MAHVRLGKAIARSELREEYRTGILRGGGTALVNFGILTLTTYSTTEDWQAALLAGCLAALTSIAAFFGLSVQDARRNDAQ